ISIIIVCFPGAPQVSQEALQQEAELEQQIDMKVEGTADNFPDPDLIYVIKFLAAEEIPGLPPGGGITIICSSWKRLCNAAHLHCHVILYTSCI
uniref:Protein serine/threonine phosphatase 2C C-terminal domain-containing protein n=1 Tax=Neolamprologus brichardi TaxID=32507 RepID=A0A3Q4GKE8_NEOBR